VAANLQAAADSLVEEIVGAPDEGTREQCQAILAKIWARHTPIVSHDSKAAMLGSTIDNNLECLRHVPVFSGSNTGAWQLYGITQAARMWLIGLRRLVM
jgi:hypothetical protein